MLSVMARRSSRLSLGTRTDVVLDSLFRGRTMVYPTTIPVQARTVSSCHGKSTFSQHLIYQSVLPTKIIPYHETGIATHLTLGGGNAPYVVRTVGTTTKIRWSSSTTTTTTTTTTSTLSELEIKKRLDEFQDLFVEARLCIEDLVESEGTKYFDEDAEAAQEAVSQAVQVFEQLIDDITNIEEKNRILRGNGLKVEQLKGELALALQGGHDH